MSTVVTKRALQTFERLPIFVQGWWGKHNIPEAGLLWETHKTLVGETNVALNLWRIASENSRQHGNEKDEIVCEDCRAKFIDSREKLSTPCPYTKQEMYGRDKEIQDIKAQLLKHENRTLSFTVICGDPGMGKTMLAQCLFHDDEVFNSFDLIDWTNCHNIEATINDNNNTCINTIHTIMRNLFFEQSLSSALLVFDGWTPKFDYKHFYDALLRLDHFDRPTSVMIIVTTTTYISPSDTSVASYSNEYDVLPPTCVQLLGLSIEESRYMFESLAFSPNVSSEEKTQIIDSEIGSKTLNLCSANPCVINTVASILSTKSTIDEWVHFVDVVWPSIPSPLKMITSTFNLVAFKRLPFLIKRCLLFCSLFPKDYEFSRVDLNLWLARELKFEDDIEDDEEPLDVELIGDQYLQMLHKIGYFVEHGKDEDGTLTYKMPIFSYEFLKFIARLDYNEYQSGGTGMYHVDPTTIRHVGFIVDDTSWRPPTWLHEAKKLQSVMFFGKHCHSLTGLEDIIASLKYLQILGGHISERLLSETGEFELLRSLRLRSTNQKLLQKFIIRMRNLRLLDLGYLENVHVLPTEFHNLQCLRHLYVRFKVNDQASPNSGELLSLTKFNVFMTGQDNLKTLVDYNNIVDNEMMDYEEWNETLRDNKTQNTALCWQSPNHRKDDIVVKTLELPESLENMTVRYWNGLTVPQFLGVVSLQIMDCHECQRLPSFSWLPKLKSFKLWNLDALEYIENVDYLKDEPYFESLRSLVLGNLPKVKAWNENDIPYKMKIIPHLTEIQISSTKLEHLPLYKGTIVSLEVKDISVQLLRSLVSSLDSEVTTILAIESKATMLKRLSISAVHGLERMRIELPMFESLIIRQCHELTKLVLQPGSNFWSLQLHECGKLRKLWNHFPQQAKLGEIEIHGCEELDLQEIGTLIPLKNHLRKLTLVNFKHLESLPSGLDSFTLLETISVSWIYNLKELPEGIGRLENLRRVVVQNCPRLITIPESLGHLMNKSTALEVKFRSCRALRQLPESFPRNQPSRLIIKECPKLERSMSYVGSV